MLKKVKRAIVWLTIAVSAAAVVEQLRRPAESRTWYGTVFGVPYDFRTPNFGRIQKSWWNPEDPRLFTPRAFGVGWDVNLYRALQLVSGSPRPAELDAPRDQ